MPGIGRRLKEQLDNEELEEPQNKNSQKEKLLVIDMVPVNNNRDRPVLCVWL